MRITQKQFDELQLRQETQTSSNLLASVRTMDELAECRKLLPTVEKLSEPVYGVAFWVPGEAKTERKRQRPMKDKFGRQFMGKRTDEPDRKDWKAQISYYARMAQPEPLHGPLILTCYTSRRKPASWPKSPTNRFPWPWAWLCRPDADNYAKLAADAIKQSGIVMDDGQFIAVNTIKVQADFEGVLLCIHEAKQDQWVEFAELVNVAANSRGRLEVATVDGLLPVIQEAA